MSSTRFCNFHRSPNFQPKENTIALIGQVAKAHGVSVKLEKVEELADIMGYGVMRTPGVVINGKVVHAGGVPSRDMIAHWLAA